MALTFQEHWIYSGSTSVPNALLQNYRKLQLTADECLLIAWLMQRHPEESFVLKYSRNLSTIWSRRKTII